MLTRMQACTKVWKKTLNCACIVSAGPFLYFAAWSFAALRKSGSTSIFLIRCCDVRSKNNAAPRYRNANPSRIFGYASEEWRCEYVRCFCRSHGGIRYGSKGCEDHPEVLDGDLYRPTNLTALLFRKTGSEYVSANAA